MLKFTLLFAIMVILAGIGCDNEDPAPTQTDDPGTAIEKSSKRGLAYNLVNAADFDSLKAGVSWWYNWHYTTDAPENYYSDYQMEFIPMIWGGNTSENQVTAMVNLIMGHPETKYLLVMNEPNLTDQANRTPAQAAADWTAYEQIISTLADFGRTIYLVGPAMNWGTMSGYADPVKWLDDFYTAFQAAEGRDPLIDYLAFHWYDYGLAAQLDRLQKYGKQIWITELANWNPQVNSYGKQIAQMREMVALCELRNDVFRYAWFIGRGNLPDDHYTYLFDPGPGRLNELGEVYISLPYWQ